VPLSGNGGPGFVFPQPLSGDDDLQNRSQVDVVGTYLLSKYQFLKDHAVDLGLRADYNSLLDEFDLTFRGGYVGKFIDKLTVKLLYGQAVQEPTMRELFGAWNGTGANPGLRSEHSQTLETDVGYNLDWLALYGDAYYVLYRDAIISTTSSGQNIGQRRVAGADLSATAIIPVPNVRQLRVWAYLSDYFLARESAATGGGMTPIGDLAKYRIWAGATLDLNPVVSITGLGRCATTRHPVSTNPLGPIAGYCTVDANVLLRDLFTDGLSLSLRVTNLLDAQYDEPGIAEADSGNTPGKWNGATWVGSNGYYNSLLPQPGRQFMLQLTLAL
jgi:outer membrane cobalamin receptor